MVQPSIHIVGGGLAGCEAAWQAAQLGCSVRIYEMRPTKHSAAHKTDLLAELVCSNSLKSTEAGSAPYLLKQEMLAFQSLILEAAYHAAIPAGGALAVDRSVFSGWIDAKIRSHPRIQVEAREIVELPSNEELEARNEIWILATGPLTSSGLAESLKRRLEAEQDFYFYDAIAPILASDSIDFDHCYKASRYGKGSGDDYLNIPLDREAYATFIQDIAEAEKMPLHDFEDARYFEACLPVEVMIERGPETLRFGPMKPVGLPDPRTGQIPHAVIQLRLENQEGSMYSMVGFQTKMKWPEQKRVFSKLPALAQAEFLRFGSIHRNTYIHSPRHLVSDLSLRLAPRIMLAGQITGVEGYSESSAIGLLVGRLAAAKITDTNFVVPPKGTMLGALHDYVTQGPNGDYVPMNVNLGLLPTIQKARGLSKKDRRNRQCEISAETFKHYLESQPNEAIHSRDQLI